MNAEVAPCLIQDLSSPGVLGKNFVMICNDKLCDNCLTLSIYQVLHILNNRSVSRKHKIVPSSLRETDALTITLFKSSIQKEFVVL